MKQKLLIVFFLSSSLYASNAFTQGAIEKFLFDKIDNKIDEDYLRTGLWIEHFDKIITFGKYEKGLKHGAWITCARNSSRLIDISFWENEQKCWNFDFAENCVLNIWDSIKATKSFSISGYDTTNYEYIEDFSKIPDYPEFKFSHSVLNLPEVNLDFSSPGPTIFINLNLNSSVMCNLTFVDLNINDIHWGLYEMYVRRDGLIDKGHYLIDYCTGEIEAIVNYKEGSLFGDSYIFGEANKAITISPSDRNKTIKYRTDRAVIESYFAISKKHVYPIQLPLESECLLPKFINSCCFIGYRGTQGNESDYRSAILRQHHRRR